MNNQNIRDPSTLATGGVQTKCQCQSAVVMVGDIYEACERMVFLGAKIIQAPGPETVEFNTAGDFDSIALIQDADGNRIKLVERIKRPHRAGIFL